VKKLKQWSQSAGNIFINNSNINWNINSNINWNINSNIIDGTSETLRNGIIIKPERLKLISHHVPTHLKPTNNDSFGHYLAGLIDGNGHFSNLQQFIIVFNSLDVSLAYFIKKKIGYGNIKKVKNKKAFLLILSSQKGIEKVIQLINGKIRTENKYNEIMNNILSHHYYAKIKEEINFKLNSSNDLLNHWLAGFSDADASFQIKMIHRNNKYEIRLNFQIEQKKKDILLWIKEFLKGNIGYRKSQDTYYYGSTSFGSAQNVIHYFDHFHLLSSKHMNYLKWRKAYWIIQDKNHWNKNGIDQIIKLKNTMNNFNQEEFLLEFKTKS
jgi:LAGLIDADG endonuclease